MAHDCSLHAGHCCVHRKEAQSLIKSGTAVCAVEAKDMTVAHTCWPMLQKKTGCHAIV